jgi:hypothetical protein
MKKNRAMMVLWRVPCMVSLSQANVDLTAYRLSSEILTTVTSKS